MNILIVEDETGISSFLKQGLEEENYHITLASDGKEGLLLAQSNAYDLILLDWMLPKMKGIDVCIEIRKKNKTTPIIFLTAKDTVHETIEGLQAGANDYIKKPFSFEELLARVRVQLRYVSTPEKPLQLGPIILSRRTRQVINEGKAVSLTQKEFALLEYLVENKGKVCTRDQIIEHVWNINFEYDTGVIDVFINSLRKKLNLKKSDDYINTVRGIGYIANDRF